MTANTAMMAAIRMPLLALDRVVGRLAMRGSDTDGRVTASIGSESAGEMGLAGSDRGSRGSGLRRGEAIAVPPLFRMRAQRMRSKTVSSSVASPRPASEMGRKDVHIQMVDVANLARRALRASRASVRFERDQFTRVTV